MKFQLFILLLLNTTLLIAQSYKEEEIELISRPSNLFGTLLVPETHNSTVALIIPGSGPTNRNGNSTITGDNNSLKYLAEDLAKNGIASLRIDKRGVGKSLMAMTKEEDLRFDTYINDVIDWGYKILNDVRFKKLIVIGHSEGSLVGMSASKELEKELPLKAYISLAGAGFPIDEILTKQLKSLSDSTQTELQQIFTKFKNGETVEKVSLPLFSLFRPSIQQYMISWIKHNPSEEIKLLATPILVINGTTDLQVGAENANNLHKSNPKSELVIIENMNHVLKKSSSDLTENRATYSNPDLRNIPELNEAIIKFINSIP